MPFVPIRLLRSQEVGEFDTRLRVPLQLMAIHHCLEAPKWRRQHSLDECMIAILTLNKNRPKPPLKQRQEMPCKP
jgi:hypothetical protein